MLGRSGLADLAEKDGEKKKFLGGGSTMDCVWGMALLKPNCGLSRPRNNKKHRTRQNKQAPRSSLSLSRCPSLCLVRAEREREREGWYFTHTVAEPGASVNNVKRNGLKGERASTCFCILGPGASFIVASNYHI